MIKSYLALGSNIGNKINYIKAAYILLECSPFIYITKKSHFYFSKAYGEDTLNDFINSVIEIKTSYKPLELLNYIKKIEKILGRKKLNPEKYENRTIDIDILFYDSLKINSENLTIPHFDMVNRDFVLFPLFELDKNLILPNKKTVSETIKTLNNTTRIVYE